MKKIKLFTTISFMLIAMALNAQHWMQVGNDFLGENYGDLFGDEVSLSADGTIMAVSAPYNRGDAVYDSEKGCVKVFEFVAGEWVQLGSDISGESQYDHLKYISLSADGLRIATGTSSGDANGDNSGEIRVFDYIDGDWVQVGETITGEAEDDYCASVCLSDDGSILAVGANGNDGNGASSGQVRVFEYQSDSWVQMGSSIYGEYPGDGIGRAFSLNSDGTVIAIGSTWNSGYMGNYEYMGHVRVFEYDNGDWVQSGLDIDGEMSGDQFGASVSLNADGTIFVAGATGNDEAGTNYGQVRVYQKQGSLWQQVGSDIDGHSAAGFFGSDVSMCDDGLTFAAASAKAYVENSSAGYVRVYTFEDNDWTQLGEAMTGDGNFHYFGSSVSISADGSVVASGAPEGYVTSTSGNGYARVFEYRNHFVPVWDGNAYDPMTFLVSGVSLNEEPLVAGDEIGIFDGDICVGLIELVGTLDAEDHQDFVQIVASKDDGTGNGYTAGNTIKYKVWDISEQLERRVSVVTFPFDPVNAYENFEPLATNFVTLKANNTVDQVVDFTTGWNMISFAVELEDMGMMNIMNPLVENETLVKMIDENGNIIEEMPWGWVDNIVEMMLTEGYYVKVSADDAITVNGEFVLYPYTIPLMEGWNMIGYPSMIPQNSTEIMTDLMENEALVKVIDQEGNIMEEMPWGWIDNIVTFNPGQGYYVKVNQATDLIIDDPEASKNLSAAYRAPEAAYFQTVSTGNPYQPMTVVLDADPLQLEIGDEIALYSNGICVGAAGYNPDKDYQYITATTDDPTTTELDGFIDGDAVEIKVYQNQSVYTVEYDVIDGSDDYGSLTTLVAKSRGITTGNENVVLNPLTLEQNRPNPMKENSVISYTLPTDGWVKLEIYNMQGQVQQMLVDENQSSGKHDVILQSNSLQPGVYVYRLSFQTASEKCVTRMKKMTVLR